VNQSTLLDEQIAYYRARAAEYDEWFLRKGRYDRGEEHNRRWFADIDVVVGKLEALAPFGDVLEFAGGTGLWTERLAARATSVTVVDASEEMIALNRARVQRETVSYIHHDIFSFEADVQFDTVFFSFWLSHVPSDRFEEFWGLVRRCLKPGGKFFLLDSLKEPLSTAADHMLPLEDHEETMTRRLNDGREFRIYKLFYQPMALQARLESLGWVADVNQTETFFIYGYGSTGA